MNAESGSSVQGLFVPNGSAGSRAAGFVLLAQDVAVVLPGVVAAARGGVVVLPRGLEPDAARAEAAAGEEVAAEPAD